MKIVHVHRRLYRGGTEMVTLYSIREGARIGLPWECIVLATDELGALEPEFRKLGVPVSLLGRVSRGKSELFWLLYRYFRQTSPRVVHIHNFGQHLIVALAARLARVPRVVLSLHGGRQWRGAESIGWSLVSWLALPFVDRQIAVSRSVFNSLSAAGMPRLKTSIVYNGIAANGKGPSFERYNTDAGRPLVIGTVIELCRSRDYRTFLKAAREVLNSLNAEFWIIGDGPERSLAECCAREENLGTSVRFWGYRDDIQRLHSGMDIFVHPSSPREGLSMALLEAMGAGLACVVARTASNPEVIEDGINGRFYRPGQAMDLAQQILDLGQNSRLRKELGIKASRTIHDKFHIRQTAEGWNEAYR